MGRMGLIHRGNIIIKSEIDLMRIREILSEIKDNKGFYIHECVYNRGNDLIIIMEFGSYGIRGLDVMDGLIKYLKDKGTEFYIYIKHGDDLLESLDYILKNNLRDKLVKMDEFNELIFKNGPTYCFC